MLRKHSMDFKKIFKSLGQRIVGKKYSGIIRGGLPVSSRKWGPNEFLSSLDISLYTNAAISKRASKVGNIEFLLQDKYGEQIENDPVLDLLYKPNPVLTGVEFWKLYQTYYDTLGEAYILLRSEREIFETSKVTEMHLLNPIQMKPCFDKWGKPIKFEYKTSAETVTYKPEEILYIYNPDPKQILRGQSILKPGVTAIQTEIQIATYHSQILANGGKVEGIFTFKTPNLTEPQLKELKARYQKEYGQAKKAGMPLFLGGDSQYIKTGLSPDELSFLEAKKMTLEDICILTSVPKSMLASTNDVKFDNAATDRATFLRETINPLLKTLTTALDIALFPDDRTLTFVDPTPENIDRKLKETENGIKNYYMTINEARERHGLDAVDEGDQIMVPFSLMPLKRSVEPVDTEKRMKSEVEHPLKDYDVRRLYWKMQTKRADAREKKFKKVIKEYFKEQGERLVEALQPIKTLHFRNKQIDELLSLELEAKLGKAMFMPMLTEMLKHAGIDALEFAGSAYQFTFSAEIASWLDNRVDVFSTKINETTFKKLKEQFAISVELEEDRDQLVSRIEDTYGNISKNRAATIARTEVHNVTQYGTMEGYKQAGMEIKIWVSVMDMDTRDSHKLMDGKERPMGMPFPNGLMFPGDPAGDPAEVVNCRCVI